MAEKKDHQTPQVISGDRLTQEAQRIARAYLPEERPLERKHLAADILSALQEAQAPLKPFDKKLVDELRQLQSEAWSTAIELDKWQDHAPMKRGKAAEIASLLKRLYWYGAEVYANAAREQAQVQPEIEPMLSAAYIENVRVVLKGGGYQHLDNANSVIRMLLADRDAGAPREAPAPARGAWQPIETAPLNGEILVWYQAGKGPRVTVGRWNSGWMGWVTDIGKVHAEGWQPLPAPPAPPSGK